MQRVLVAVCLGSLIGGVQAAELVERRYAIADRGFLVVSVPAEWREELQRRDATSPPTIRFRPASGAPFEVLLTPIPPAKLGMPPPSAEELKRGVLGAAEKASARSVEDVLPANELLGAAAQGFYFKATDRAPKAGEFKHLTQGMLGLEDIRIGFTVLTNDGQAAAVDAAFGVLRTARHIPADGSRAGAPQGASPRMTPSVPMASATGAPATASEPPDALLLQGLLERGAIPALDAALSAYQEAYRKGAIGDEAAAQAFIALTRDDPDLRPLYDKWVGERPSSYVARLARGYYLAELGYQARGTASAAKTTRAQFGDMRELFKLALDDLQTSLKLDPKPALSYGTMIWITQGSRDRRDAAKYLDDAILTDPRVFTARASYLAMLRPEWGGSLEEMAAAIASWKNALQARQVAALERMLEDARWRTALEPAAELVNQKQYREAIVLYDQALQKGDPLRAYAMRGFSYAQLGEHAKAIADFDRVLQIEPSGGCCRATRFNRARSHLAMRAMEQGLADLFVAAQNDDQAAVRELAAMYAFGKHGFKKDFSMARQWCARAAKQGDGLSMYCMGGIFHAGLGVPKDAGAAAQWFGRAAERGVPDAQADLAFMLWNGQGIGQDREQAIKWWRAAAKQGNKRAATQLESNLSSWEYFSKITFPAWIEENKRSYPWLYLVLVYLGMVDV
jgi:TPR repeat protein